MFLSSSHTLSEFEPEIEKLRGLVSDISGLDDVLFYDMIQLDCSDVKTGLLRRAEDLLSLLVHQLATDHITDNQRYCHRVVDDGLYHDIHWSTG